MIRRTQREDKVDNVAAEQLATLSKPTSAAAEAYRTLRTNLLYDALVDVPSKVIVLTSPGVREDTGTVCANLGVVLAQAGRSTLVVDCDLRNPVLHEIFGLREPQSRGIVDVVTGERSLEDAWQEPLPDLKVITGIPSPLDPMEILGSERFTRFLGQMRRDFDLVLIDAPPTGLVSDAAILAAQSDGVLIVSDYENTRKRDVRQAMRSLEAVRANVLGTVLTGVKAPRDAYRR
jgi:capsular exopolysaccharide synthesis family protein